MNCTNQLQSINDGTTSDLGLLHGGWSYTYDGNGNVKNGTYAVNSAKSKNITAYNILNLPQNGTAAGVAFTFTYDAAGQKLRKVSGTTTTDYINGIQYTGTTTTDPAISFIQTEEGRAVPNGSGYDYEYTLADHLGNNRVNFTTTGGTATATQVDDYYAFGMDINRTPPIPNLKNNYLYNKKELQEELGQYDYGARLYDPVIGRWGVVDPLTEKGRRETPYGYTFDDPMRFTDPDGMWPDGDCCGVVGAFASGLYNDLKGAVVGTIHAVTHPIQTAKGIADLAVNPIVQAEAGMAVVSSAKKGYQKFKNGDANEKAGIIGAAFGEVGQLFGGEIAEVSKVGKLAQVGRLSELADKVGEVSKLGDFNQARNKALEWLESKGFKAEEKTLGRFGYTKGKGIGMKTSEKYIGFRVEFDENNGAHINVFAGKEKGPHFKFDASEKTVKKIQKKYN